MKHTPGKGNDRKGTRRDGLKWKWQWLQRRRLSGYPASDTRRLSCTTCEAVRRTRFGDLVLEVSAGYSKDGMKYEAEVHLSDNILASTGADTDADTSYSTRLEAQLQAEDLIAELLNELQLVAAGRI